jgi:ADP-heptose:LPS heptosyltransferase
MNRSEKNKTMPSVQNVGNVFVVTTLEEIRTIERKYVPLTMQMILQRCSVTLYVFLFNCFIYFLEILWFRLGKPTPNNVRTIVVYTQGTLGDNVVQIPAIAALKKLYVNSKITLVTYCALFPIEQLYSGSDIVDGFINLTDHPVVRKGTQFLLSDHRLQLLRCDLFVNLSPFGNRGVPGFLLRELIFAKKSRARWVAGFRLITLVKRGSLDSIQHFFVQNEPRRAAAIVKCLGIENLPLIDALPHNTVIREKVIDLLKSYKQNIDRIVVINPGAKFEVKCWPTERFGDVVRQLHDHDSASIVITGTATERELCESVRMASGEIAINLAGETSLQDLVELLRLSKLCITNDTGTMHIAALAGVDVVALFGTRLSPSHWFPRGANIVALFSFSEDSYTFRDEGVVEKGILNIQVSDVLEAAQQLISRSTKAS